MLWVYLRFQSGFFGLFGQALGESTLKTYKSLSRLKVLKDFLATLEPLKTSKNVKIWSITRILNHKTQFYDLKL